MWIALLFSSLSLLVSLAVAVMVLRRKEPETEREFEREFERELPEDLLGLRQEVAALQQSTAGAMRHLAVVRYDAFGDVGGHLSWSMALLDDAGDGVVMTSIHGRTESRTYAKSVTGWRSDATMSEEEEEAVAHARP